MGIVERIGNGGNHSRGLIRRQPPVRRVVGQILPIDQFRDNEPYAPVLADIVHRHNIRMLEARRLARFLQQLVCLSRAERRPASGGRAGTRRNDRWNLDGDLAFQLRIKGPPDFAEAANPQQLFEPIAPNQRAGRASRRHRPVIAGFVLHPGCPAQCIDPLAHLHQQFGGNRDKGSRPITHAQLDARLPTVRRARECDRSWEKGWRGEGVTG